MINKTEEQMIEKTESICPVCKKKIKAKIVLRKNKIFLEKACEKHGKYKIELDRQNFFFNVKTCNQFKAESSRLEIPVSRRCNLNCSFCYYPYKKEREISIDEILRISKRFEGDYICFSGGEPTLRKDIFQIIKKVANIRKIPVLVTNGIMLEDKKYVKRLKKSGVGLVHIPLNSMKKDPYNKNGQEITKKRIKAINNLEKEDIFSSVSFMAVKDPKKDEKTIIELSEVIKFLLKKRNIFELKIRSANAFGRHKSEDYYKTSELVELYSKSISTDPKKMINKMKEIKTGKALCRFSAISYFDKKNFRHIKSKPFGRTGRSTIHSFLWRNSPFFLRKNVAENYRILDKLLKIKDFGGSELIKTISRNKTKSLRIEIRSWPNKYNLDMKEIEKCPSKTYNIENGKIEPFCYSYACRDDE